MRAKRARVSTGFGRETIGILLGDWGDLVTATPPRDGKADLLLGA
jgi:hypothetical protein